MCGMKRLPSYDPDTPGESLHSLSACTEGSVSALLRHAVDASLVQRHLPTRTARGRESEADTACSRCQSGSAAPTPWQAGKSAAAFPPQLPNRLFRLDGDPVYRPMSVPIGVLVHRFYQHQEQSNGGRNSPVRLQLGSRLVADRACGTSQHALWHAGGAARLQRTQGRAMSLSLR
jgi:hypothetical protein